ncbi:MAG: glycosyltransferase 87 family protein [Acidimicrobiales bacterium]
MPPMLDKSSEALNAGASRRVTGSRSFSWALGTVSLVVWSFVALQLAHRVNARLPLDFQVYRDAARNMLDGRATYHAHFTFKNLNFTYPPFALLLFSVLALIPATVALAGWWAVNLAALVAFVYVALGSLSTLPSRVALLSSFVIAGASCLWLEPVRSSLAFGQINFLLMFAVAVDLMVVRSSIRGVLVGLAAAVKLTPLIYIAYFFAARTMSSTYRAIGTFVAASVVAWLILPSDSVTFWFHQAFSPGHKGGAKGNINQSLFGLLGRFSTALGSSIIILWLALCVVTFILGVYCARRYVADNRFIEALLALALTEVLVSPISWPHHWSWIILVPVLLITRWGHDHWVDMAMIVLLAVAVLAPYRLFHHHHHHRVVPPLLPGYSLVFAGIMLLFVMSITELHRHRRDRMSIEAPLSAPTLVNAP